MIAKILTKCFSVLLWYWRLKIVMDRLFVANSLYSFFTYLLMFPDKVKETLFIVGPVIKDVHVPIKMIFDIPSQECQEDEILAQGFSLANDVYRSLDGKQLPCYGDANETNNPFINRFINRYPFYALSDGLSDYELFPKYYQDERILKCYSTADIIKDLTHSKLEKFDIQKLWNNLSEEHKDKIVDIFNVQPKAMRKILSSRLAILPDNVNTK